MKKNYLPGWIIFVFALSLVAATLSCKKESGREEEEDPSGQHFMKFKMDGTEYHWTRGYSMKSNSSDGVLKYRAITSETNDRNTNSITVEVSHNGSIALGVDHTYPGPIPVSIVYEDKNDGTYNSYGVSGTTATMRIIKDEPLYIKGTFRGTVKNSSGDIKTITDGEFVLQTAR